VTGWTDAASEYLWRRRFAAICHELGYIKKAARLIRQSHHWRRRVLELGGSRRLLKVLDA